ncbi:transposase [Chryseobacterium sp. Tr-659]|uniref:transposase n=1 Tax=Chryseobacterium sp. Tr-659 TaxID=2608340 RepID=UPI0014205AD0|nr:transposase [Chryseobacterium sp. Tr-659]NIF06694.1 transposase [Chryseobacterium sp. Tr-659]
MNFKDIHIGLILQQTAKECNLDTERACKFLDCDIKELENMYKEKCMNTDLLIRWSKLLKYDFFRLYSHHLILYAPAARFDKASPSATLPHFRKNLYTMEIIDFIIELIETGQKTELQIRNEYNIPKTTLIKWIKKYRRDN